ncbi:MAG: type II secretion system protein GspG [Candidatus Ancaeobacter aquaticus]|nr:type II secretion system protein GspG [Candidatus Ancaeobacter aquaticus]
MISRSKNGFTLVEILAVLFIIALIAGITIPVMHSMYSKSKTAKAKSDIARLTAAADLYNAEWGTYPASSNANLVIALESESPFTKKPYLSFKTKDIENNKVVDAWGKPYIYVLIIDPDNETETISIESSGPNATAGDSDDITSAQ